MMKIIIPRSGPARTVYSPDAIKIAEALGTATTRRASHVEPGGGLGMKATEWLLNQYEVRDNGCRGTYVERNPNTGRCTIREAFAEQWFADLTPVDGPVLGPFALRDTALSSELAWLHEHGIPTAK